MSTTDFNKIIIIESLGVYKSGTRLYEGSLMYVEHHQPFLTTEHYSCSTKNEFLGRLGKIAVSVEAGEYVPVLHIDMHGHKSGLELESEETINWDELAVLLTRINKACGNRLMLVMSACNR